MPSNGLIVLASLKPECQDHLRNVLNQVGNDVKGKRLAGDASQPHIDLPGSRTIHFARLAILDDPERGPGRKRLLLVTDYDGDWYNHVIELFSLTSDPETIWGCCEGYSGPPSFSDFIRSYTVEPQAYYIAFPGLSLNKIRSIARWQSSSTHPPLMKDPGSLTNIALHSLGDLTRLPLTGLSVLELILRRGLLNTLFAARRVNATLDRVPWIRIFNRLTLNSFPLPTQPYSSAPVDTTADCAPESSGDEVISWDQWKGVPSEDLVSQNQLTLVTVVHPDRLPQLQAVLEVIQLYARRLAERGSLVGISTIHTVRWALLDGGKRLLMASNYDGTWENYIDEFAELILSGLDAIWESSHGFPELGAQDVAAFKLFLRCHQVPANVFYSAYPQATVPNILEGLQMEQDWSSEL